MLRDINLILYANAKFSRIIFQGFGICDEIQLRMFAMLFSVYLLMSNLIVIYCVINVQDDRCKVSHSVDIVQCVSVL